MCCFCIIHARIARANARKLFLLGESLARRLVRLCALVFMWNARARSCLPTVDHCRTRVARFWDAVARRAPAYPALDLEGLQDLPGLRRNLDTLIVLASRLPA
jgi:hypothetical protein